MNFAKEIANELQLNEVNVSNVLDLLAENASIPFIARYRKEATGSMDEVLITAIRDRYKQMMDVENRRAVILNSILEQDKLTPELQIRIEQAKTLPELEDIYLPYKPKRRTRASIARQKGLEPLANEIYKQRNIFTGAHCCERCGKYYQRYANLHSISDKIPHCVCS